MHFGSVRIVLPIMCLFFGSFEAIFPEASAQSPQVAREWALFNQILMIGIIVGIVVFGLMFYAIIRYREKPEKAEAP